MEVYHEPRPPKYRVTPDLWRNQDPPGRTKLNTCIKATRVLEMILEDLGDELRHPDIAAQVVQDAADLITLISYLFYEPLLNVRAAVERWSVPDDLKYEVYPAYMEALDRLYRCLNNAIEFVYRALGSHPAITAMIQKVYAFSASEDDESLEISAICPFELLLRVVTARERWANHEALFKAYKKLKINDAIIEKICIPQSGFACLGMTVNGDPICVLAFSADYWTGYKEMDTFVRELRDSRRHAFDGVQRQQIVEWSSALGDRYREGMTPLSLIANPPGHFTHEDYVASPFRCDTFKPRDRCTRCQALFKYEVIEVVRNLEAAKNQRNKHRRPNQNWSCAEVYAHFFCQELSENGHSPCEMH
ncbi:uncharacterized protein FFUJ_03801 [Fusarium fujikuroi IMI 58289]|uniref:Uncharacterized protein n=1 Tax=Gibberella fujikuroi (strain CBS 195.34 / IMI 58289 / NRRL A-6831) TaxID=1279085 RepID=S0DU63_GIBF5|nr:uncharacterized protein FFUJ_03801 [Fusarium fujikuroi IMI 58289]QGI61248.1 hypothetical protein CEK27_005219 [Fusarium fujikuroi]QGI92146.1 hypothetical protein CEK26_005215 [Fusarium fujikuroi]CCT64932.1 uncharacterized protein FFUJ_03801 [Fusarium fujikuroi IMI 58289]SCN71833.1 uncharacterized protein FFE2_02396 [Fusarium fujikuroi]SCN90125.1 uncharacterized protein FFM5_04882 [Fusarium fujikuroi]